MNFEQFSELDNKNQEQFVEMNGKNNSSLTNGMPESLRSMFIELTFIGALFSEPRYAKKYEEFIKPKWDFTSASTKFFYAMLIEIGKRTEWKITEETVNSYMADNKNRLKNYQQYGSYKWIEYTMNMAKNNNALDNIENCYNMVKKYSLVREFWRRGLKDLMEQIVQFSEFPEMKPREILLKALKVFGTVYTKLANGEEVKDLTSECEEYIDTKLERPERGIDFPFPIMSDVFQGMRLGQFMAWGMLSNAGKSRFLIRMIANLAFVHNEKILIISNEMTEEEMRVCLITTAINNKDIQNLHNVSLSKNQNEIQNGVYSADAEYYTHKDVIDGKVVRNQDETINEYRKKLFEMSSEYRAVKTITRWIDTKMKDRIRIIETGSDYADNDLQEIIDNTSVSEGIKFVFYDTFKNDKDSMGDWAAMKKTATMLSEIAKKRNIFIGANIQLTDDANMCKPLELTSNNIANSKQIKHVLDSLCLFKEIPVSDYHNYIYWKTKTDSPKQNELIDLEKTKRYYVCRIDKNRAGIKPDLLFELNLNTNTWNEVGRVGWKRSYKVFTERVSVEETNREIEKQQKNK